MQARGGEIHISGNVLPLFDRNLTDQMFGPASLMRRDDKFVAIKFLYRRLKVVKVSAAGVSLVAQHHPRPLPVAHRRSAGIGQQIDVHVARAQQERVVPRLFQCFGALRGGGQPYRFDHLDLEGLGPTASSEWHAFTITVKAVRGPRRRGREVELAVCGLVTSAHEDFEAGVLPKAVCAFGGGGRRQAQERCAAGYAVVKCERRRVRALDFDRDRGDRGGRIWMGHEREAHELRCNPSAGRVELKCDGSQPFVCKGSPGVKGGPDSRISSDMSSLDDTAD